MEVTMRFYIVKAPWNKGTQNREYPYFELVEDKWNDHGYETLFTLYFFDENGGLEIGQVKILHETENRTRYILKDFNEIGPEYCSLGEGMSFYRNLRKIPNHLHSEYFSAMNDISYKKKLRQTFRNIEGIENSFFRSSESEKVYKSAYNKFFLNREEEAEIFNFLYKFQVPYSDREYKINYNFENIDFLPNRINIVIGKNGTGKTQMLSQFAKTLSGTSMRHAKEFFEPRQLPLFTKVIAVSFSAFDDFEKPDAIQRIDNDSDLLEDDDDFDENEYEVNDKQYITPKRKQNNYVYCGIQNKDGRTYSLSELKENGERAFDEVEKLDRTEKWKEVLINVFGTESIVITNNPRELFKTKLSSGQNIILSIITEVIANIEDESILLFDEPELHLHPNAISSLMRMLYDLLNLFKSYSIITTHSPLLIQETPSRCIRVLDRIDNALTIHELAKESFGENISTITDEVFHVRDNESNYKAILRNASDIYSFEEILKKFPKGLSMNALTYLNIIYSNKKKRDK
jgi:predicted ATPase